MTSKTEWPWMDSLMFAVDILSSVYAETNDPRCWLAVDLATRNVERGLWDEVSPDWIAGIVAGIRAS